MHYMTEVIIKQMRAENRFVAFSQQMRLWKRNGDEEEEEKKIEWIFT